MRASAGVLLALALPAPAAAQTAIWSATLTAGQVSGADGTSTGYTTAIGSLSDTEFDLAGTSYTITHITLAVVPVISLDELRVGITPALGDIGQRLTLHLGSASFALSAATVDQAGTSFDWSGHGLTWSVDDTVQARLTFSNAAPDFGADSTTREVAENSDAGTNVGAAVTATDGNDDTLTYSLEGTDAASFQIVSASGQIQTTSGVTYDYETTPSYAVTVKADDGLGGTDTIAVAIDLTDVNEPPPTIDSVDLTSDPGADETYAIGDTVTATVTFDRAVAVTGTPQLTLRVGGGDPVNLKPANYTSGSGTTTLRFTYVVQMDDEDTNGIYLEADELELNGGTIKGDSDGLDATRTYIRPGQQSDQKVDGVRPTPTAAAVPQNGGTLTVTFTETLSSTTAGTGPFTVTAAGATRPVSSVAASGSTVTLTLASAIAAGQAVSVTYTDPSAGNDGAVIQDAVGNDAATFTQTVTNNSQYISAAPDFGAESATREVAENSAAGTNVGAPVTATDADSGDTLTYTLDGTDAASFDIVSTSGQIQTTSGVTYDYETKSSYAVIVKADDGNGGSDTIMVTITVTDVDESPSPGPEPVPTPALPLLGHLLLALGLTAAGARVIRRRPRVPPAA